MLQTANSYGLSQLNLPGLPKFRSAADQVRDFLVGELSSAVQSDSEALAARYRYDPAAYISDKLGWLPWAGIDGQPGQLEVIEAYALALRQLHERHEWEQGEKTAEELEYWRPGQVIKNRIRIEAGHTVGKTKLAAGIFSHFFDTCAPSIIYTFAPGWDQINDLLWKEIRTDRDDKAELLGQVMKTPELKYKGNHFAKGRATSNAHGTGTERTQGQHGKYLMFILDEAEGIADFVWSAIESMTGGGMAIVLMLANPRTRTSKFFKQRTRPDVVSFRLSCVWHPNVINDREIVPGAVRREYVTNMVRDHAEAVAEHNADDHTFELPWELGVIYKPDTELMFRVLGIAPGNVSDNTFVPVGRYEAACERKSTVSDTGNARMGVDVARYGSDMGTLYIRHNGKVWRAAQFAQQDTNAYRDAIRREAKKLAAAGVHSLHIRGDAGGGYLSGVVDPLKIDMEIRGMFKDFRIIEVHFNGTPHNGKAYDDMITEMYAEAGETLKGLAIANAPESLEDDLCARPYKWVNRSGTSVKKLMDKEKFKTDYGRSPDDGDGCVLAIAPDFLFKYSPEKIVLPGMPKQSTWTL